jgi:AraC-type DNA-binding domain-containing proteins
MSNIVQLFNDARQVISQDYIYDFVIYFSNSSLAITSQGTTDFDEFFNSKLKSIIYPPEFWKKFADVKHTMKIIPSVVYSDTTIDNKTYYKKLIGVVGNNKMNTSKLSILVFIDVKALLERVNQQSMAEGSSLVVMDQDKKVILNTDTDFNIDIIDDIHFNKEFEYSINDGKYDYYCIKSRYNDFIYISKTPYISEKLIPETKTSLWVIILAFILVTGVCVLLFLYLYIPVKKMFTLLHADSNGRPPESFDDACNAVKLICNENRLYKEQIEQVDDDIRRSIFYRMIDDIGSNKKLNKKIDIYFKAISCCRNYAMVGLKFEALNSSEENGFNNTGKFSVDNINSYIQKSLENIFDYPVLFYIENFMFVALVGLKENDDRKLTLVKISGIMEELKLATENKYAITIALSRFYEEAEHCKKSYIDIKACMAYRNIKPICSIIDYEKINSKTGMYFPSDQIDKLSNLIICGNGKESKAIVDHVITGNIEKGISYIKFINVVGSIFNSIVNSMEGEIIKNNEIAKLEMEFFEKAGSICDYKELQRIIETAIDRVTSDLSSKRQSKLNKEFIIEYINLHYAEDLYLEYMSQMTETSPKYFSNYFKKAIGTNFIEYVTKVRIRHAKELLKNTDILVSDIGEKVGFSNSSTFTSTFKKYCGISPIEYRKDSCNKV